MNNQEHSLLSLDSFRYGAWIVGGRQFTSKFEALHHASINKQPVSFYYHDKVWLSVNRSLLGRQSLTSLYRERALQLREKYDHLVLHYSGGSDSHNILHTFLSNGIKLDEVNVWWAIPLRDGKFYTISRIASARNGVSEWDLTIKPALDKLHALHPEIKITVTDPYANMHSIPLNVVCDVNNSRVTSQTQIVFRNMQASFVC